MSNVNNLQHYTNPQEFISAIEFTAQETGFQPLLIEKDYYCSVVLAYLSTRTQDVLTFKGGTLLAKGHAGFYRLSEDLDFTLPISALAKRSQRSKMVKPFKSIVKAVSEDFPVFTLTKELAGSNESRQYNAELTYQSLLNDQPGRILVEISLREELLEPAQNIHLNTVLLNPFSGQPIASAFTFQSLSRLEAYAQKIRAALNKKRLAIRDYFDIYYALKNKLIDLNDNELIRHVSIINGNPEDIIEFNDETRSELERKIDRELAPTLRHQNMGDFNLNQVIQTLQKLMNVIRRT